MISSGPITKAMNSPDFDIIWTRLLQESDMKMFPTESCVMYLRSISSRGDKYDGRSYVNNFFPKLLIATMRPEKLLFRSITHTVPSTFSVKQDG